MTQTRIKKDLIRDQNRGNWEKIETEWKKMPSDESYVKRIDKHIKAFKSISHELKKVLESLPARSTTAGAYHEEPIVIRDAWGEGSPQITDTLIRLNGDASSHLNHETFMLKIFDMGGYSSQSEIAEEGLFSFCKTARKPYDFVVCVSLMIAKHHLGADFKISSDGGFSDWQPAIEYYENLFNRKAPKQLVSYLTKEEQEAN